MFERFTDRARRAIVVAQHEARSLDHCFIQPEHLLLGLADGDGLAALALRQCGLDAGELRSRTAEALASTPSLAKGVDKVPFSAPAKKALELSLREALRLGHNYIGTEHILLGLLRGADHRLERVLAVSPDALRAAISSIMPGAFAGGTSVSRSPALVAAIERARVACGTALMSTGDLLGAFAADPECHAARVLAELGIGAGELAAALERVPAAGTSDAPMPRSLEVRVGEVTTTVDDPALVALLEDLSAEEIQAALRRALLAPGAGDGTEEGGEPATA